METLNPYSLRNQTDFLSVASVFMITANLGSIFMIFMPRVIWFFIFVICLTQIIKGKGSLNHKMIVGLLFIWVICLLSSLLTNTAIHFYNVIILNSLLAILVLAANRSYKNISDNIYISCKIISYLGLINYLLVLFLPFLFSFEISSIGFGVHTFLYLFNYQTGQIIRNQALFWEPGVFQIVLNVFLFMILIERKEPFKKAILPIILVISTFSTTGLIIMSLIITYYYFKVRKKRLSIKTIFLPFILCVVLAPFIYNNVTEKISSDKDPSAALRTYDLYMGLNIIKNNPLGGIGMDPNQFKNRAKGIDIGPYDVSDLDIARGNTNSIISIAAVFGLPVLMVFLATIYKQRVFNNRKVFFIIIFLSLFSEPIYTFPLILLFNISSIKKLYPQKYD